MSPQAFFTEYKWFFNFFNLLALAPFSGHPKIQHFLTAYSSVQILIIPIIFMSFKLFSWDFHIMLSSFVTELFSVTLITTHLIISLQAFCTRHQHFCMVNVFVEIDQLINQELGIDVRYKWEKRSIRRKLAVILIIMITLEVCLTYFNLKILDAGSVCWPFYYSYAIIQFKCLQIIFYALLLKNRLDVVNKNMDEFVLNNYFWHDSQLKTKKPDRNSLDDKTAKFYRLLILKRAYGKLYDVNKLLNETCGWSLLAIFTKAFTSLTSSVYWTFLSITYTGPHINIVSVHVLSILHLIFPATILTYYCNTCTTIVSLHLNYKNLLLAFNVIICWPNP